LPHSSKKYIFEELLTLIFYFPKVAQVGEKPSAMSIQKKKNHNVKKNVGEDLQQPKTLIRFSGCSNTNITSKFNDFILIFG